MKMFQRKKKKMVFHKCFEEPIDSVQFLPSNDIWVTRAVEEPRFSSVYDISLRKIQRKMKNIFENNFLSPNGTYFVGITHEFEKNSNSKYPSRKNINGLYSFEDEKKVSSIESKYDEFCFSHNSKYLLMSSSTPPKLAVMELTNNFKKKKEFMIDDDDDDDDEQEIVAIFKPMFSPDDEYISFVDAEQQFSYILNFDLEIIYKFRTAGENLTCLIISKYNPNSTEPKKKKFVLHCIVKN